MTSNGGRLPPDVTRVSFPQPVPPHVATCTSSEVNPAPVSHAFHRHGWPESVDCRCGRGHSRPCRGHRARQQRHTTMCHRSTPPEDAIAKYTSRLGLGGGPRRGLALPLSDPHRPGLRGRGALLEPPKARGSGHNPPSGCHHTGPPEALGGPHPGLRAPGGGGRDAGPGPGACRGPPRSHDRAVSAQRLAPAARSP